MASAPDDVRREKIADALRPFMAEGEELVIRNREGEISATPPATRKLREEHPQLYGQLLSANEQLQGGGCGGLLVGILGAGAVSLGLALGWWDDALGNQAADVLRDSWWFYLFLFIVGIGAPSYLSELRGKLVYRRLRSDLLATLEADSLDRDLLVAMIQGEPELSAINRCLKLDRGMTRPRPEGAA